MAQHLRDANPDALHELALHEDTPPAIAHNLADYYLPALGADDLSAEIRDTLAEREAQRAAEAAKRQKQQKQQEETAESSAPDPRASDSSMHHMIEEHPRAYRSWTVGEEREMQTMLDKGLSIGAVADKLQRAPSAVRSRLRKLETRSD